MDERGAQHQGALRQRRQQVDRRAHEVPAERLGGFKVPKAIAFRDSLPRTASGKLQRAALPEIGIDTSSGMFSMWYVGVCTTSG